MVWSSHVYAVLYWGQGARRDDVVRRYAVLSGNVASTVKACRLDIRREPAFSAAMVPAALAVCLAAVGMARGPPRGPSAAEKEAGRAIAAHAKARRWRQALGVLRSLPEQGLTPNTVHYNAAINACGRGGKWSVALSLLDELNSGGPLRPNEYTFTTTIAALHSAPPAVGASTALRMLEQMHGLGLQPSTAAHNAAIRVLGAAGQSPRALDLLTEMKQRRQPPPDTITYNAAISALSESGDWALALRLLDEAEASPDAPPDVVTYTSCMTVLRSGGQWERALQMMSRMRAAG